MFVWVDGGQTAALSVDARLRHTQVNRLSTVSGGKYLMIMKSVHGCTYPRLKQCWADMERSKLNPCMGKLAAGTSGGTIPDKQMHTVGIGPCYASPFVLGRGSMI